MKLMLKLENTIAYSIIYYQIRNLNAGEFLHSFFKNNFWLIIHLNPYLSAKAAGAGILVHSISTNYLFMHSTAKCQCRRVTHNHQAALYECATKRHI